MIIELIKGLKYRYHRLWVFSVLLASAISITPLLIISKINFNEYEKVLSSELIHPVSQLLSNTKQSLEFFIEERIAALTFIIHEHKLEEISSKAKLMRVFSALKRSFDGFIDIGVIDLEGNQISYIGPYELEGVNYKNHNWFQVVKQKGVHVSDVFMGYRKFPHFVIAMMHEVENEEPYIIRATLSTEFLTNEIVSLELRPHSDAFLINSSGVLQTPSRFYGQIMRKTSLTFPTYNEKGEVIRKYDVQGRLNLFGYAYINQTPFVLIVIKTSEGLLENWNKTKNKMLIFLVVSIILIIVVIIWSVTLMVKGVYRADLKQASMQHDIQYTNKMASIGRLAAGVAHEINNPLAIISEKAGLIADMIHFKKDFAHKEQTEEIITAMQKSVGHCSAITHRLLGFAKRMDIKADSIDLEVLMNEVISFFDREASIKHIHISLNIEKNIPAIRSDRGLLQQVFVNIINNSIHDIDEKGDVTIYIRKKGSDHVAVEFKDDGRGLSDENLEKIFEPFFTAKKDYGTGLGLSITYGIVKKLGGNIRVESEMFKGTRFIITLPLTKEDFRE